MPDDRATLDTTTTQNRTMTYRVGSIIRALEMHHTVNARKGSASTLAAMRIQLLLGQNISARLTTRLISISLFLRRLSFWTLSVDSLRTTPSTQTLWPARQLTSHENDTILT